MRRREFIAGLGGVAASPLVARAQPGERMRRISILSTASPHDPYIVAAQAAFLEALSHAGWMESRNIRIERRYGSADDSHIRADAADIIARSPDVIVCSGTQVTAIVKQQTSTIPVVFLNVADPVTSGFVANFPHPGGNITGFTSLEFSLAGKWLSILKDIAPRVHNVMVLYSPDNSNWRGYLQTLQSAAPVLGISLSAMPAAGLREIERQIDSFAQHQGAGMIVVPSGQTIVNREMIAALAMRHRLPAIYSYKYFATSGGLVSYGTDTADSYRRVAQYVDRILRGEKPADLPVQQPTKFELVINLKTAKALGLTIPETLLATADEVIQ
jgi:putative tryptophan/tyrosine transport system substrate-binding protein